MTRSSISTCVSSSSWNRSSARQETFRAPTWSRTKSATTSRTCWASRRACTRRASASTRVEANQLSVRQELQADCFAGIWAHDANQAANFLEPGDIEEGLGAASAIGDDTLQRNAGQAVVPDAFTHGSSEQRIRWFTEGFRKGSVESCDTFKAADL